jgi:hypothetical protein
MGRLTCGFHSAGNFGIAALLLACALTAGSIPAFCSGPNYETIEASAKLAGQTVAVTLIVYDYSTSEVLQILSQAFEEGHDRGLATALSKLKAVGHFSITGTPGYDVAFIQTVATPAGRKITFITSRPIEPAETNPDTSTQSFDLAVGRFDLNDSDVSKSTGFLYPASKLVIDPQGQFHYDLAGVPLALVNVVAGKETPGAN